jgi:hypothetical protein
MTDRTSAEARTWLVALGEPLKSRFDVELTGDELVIVCDRSRPGNSVTITCACRSDDGGRLWFFGAGGDPIAEADHIADTIVTITGYLAGRRP